MYDDVPLEDEDFDGEYETRRSQLGEFCQVDVNGHGSLDVEEDYVPRVVQCEHGGAPLETLKAQAIAARTYAKFFHDVEGRPLAPSTDDQKYDCGQPPSEEVKRAVRETQGQVLTHDGSLIASFYVAGSPHVDPNSCHSTQYNPYDAYEATQKYVTYNEGKIGGAVEATTLGSTHNPANRGALGQNGSACLANNGWSHERILRFFYGDDIRVTQLGGACVDSEGDPSQDGGISDGGGPAEGETCEADATDPNVITRSEWGARPPKQNSGHHTPEKFTIHHTVGPNDYADGKSVVKGIQNFHMDDPDRLWWDIGYHYLIDDQGNIYQGRPVDRVGAHAAGANTNNVGIAILGTYNSAEPTETELAATAEIMRHVADQYDIDINQNTVFGHRDFRGGAAGDCPGDLVYNKLDRIIGYANGEAGGECDDAGGSGQGYRYLRVEAMTDDPAGVNDTIEGFELDSVYVERSDGSVDYATAVDSASNASQPENALGEPDNDSCDNRTSTVAGIQTGGDIVFEFDEPIGSRDIVNVVQGSYNTAQTSCSPSGTAKVTVSPDRNHWDLLDDDVHGTVKLAAETTYVRFREPVHDSTHEPLVQFAVDASSDVAEVDYLADDWSMGSSTEAPNFPFEYEFQNMGRRHLRADAYDDSGDLIASDEISIDVERGGAYDSQMGDTLGAEGGICSGEGNNLGGPRCSDGKGGYSTGYCWGYVKAAMIRAGLATRADIDQLAAAAGMTSYQVQVSAAGFKQAADAAPQALQSTMGLERVDTPPTEAPRGAVVAYAPNCMDAHSQYGHIEIAYGDGYACSDYCAPIRGNASCASVYVPTGQ